MSHKNPVLVMVDKARGGSIKPVSLEYQPEALEPPFMRRAV